ncbi:hypothetical protein BU24DRAFT_84981 [Aaosphaeria arxii CBS 175.79]|uniref:Uncharacterized protein n=1 Tax=Aaosphaeria arxii CBS 175.79 TaxID=1450172 RepID=A0A6A5X8H2_9PLEO|nr:uncharacterized protein BU24DRAFT_84981 [Aaosphaeria arxii CBS 175.79]KAF2009216.1 hypothetical protein BU24DRAFT_84981 [Aaosphaeria arxii CBS 175.79]
MQPACTHRSSVRLRCRGTAKCRKEGVGRVEMTGSPCGPEQSIGLEGSNPRSWSRGVVSLTCFFILNYIVFFLCTAVGPSSANKNLGTRLICYDRIDRLDSV